MTRARNPSKVFERIAKNRWHRLFTDEEQKTDYSHGHGMLFDCHFKHLQIVGAFFLHKPNFLQAARLCRKIAKCSAGTAILKRLMIRKRPSIAAIPMKGHRNGAVLDK